MFHVNLFFEQHRVADGEYASPPGARYGAFRVPSPITGDEMVVLATDGEDPTISKDLRGWEHVSVSYSRRKRLPNWLEMCWLKDAFWDQEDCVVQYHPPRAQYINFHEAVLHLWKHARLPFPQPPTAFVGPNISMSKQ